MSNQPMDIDSNTPDEEENKDKQSAVRESLDPDSDLNLDGSFKCLVCGKVEQIQNHAIFDALKYLLLKNSNQQTGYCSSKCFNKDILPSTVHQTIDDQLLAQNIKHEAQLWDASHVEILNLINQCIKEGSSTYGDNFKMSGFYRAHDKVYELLNEYNILYHLLYVQLEWGTEKRRFYLAQGKDIDYDLVESVSNMLSENVNVESYNILQTVLTNIIDKITNDKVRKLPMDAPKVKKFIVEVPNVIQSLKKLGFSEKNIDGREMLVWPISENLENLKALLPKVKILASGGKLSGSQQSSYIDPLYTYGSTMIQSEKSNIKSIETSTKVKSNSESLREKAKQIQLDKEEEDKRKERERERRRVKDGKISMQAKQEFEEKQRELRSKLEKEQKKREKQQDKEAKKRLQEQIKKEKEARLAEKQEKNL